MHTLRKKITEYIKSHKITVSKLERELKLSNSSIVKILDGRAQNPTIKTILKIADALDCSTDELLNRQKYCTTLLMPSIEGSECDLVYNNNLFRSVCFQVLYLIETYEIKQIRLKKVEAIIKQIYNHSLEKNLQIVDRAFADQLLKENLLS